MSATIWTEVEVGSERAPVRTRHQGYWSGNQNGSIEQAGRRLKPTGTLPGPRGQEPEGAVPE